MVQNPPVLTSPSAKSKLTLLTLPPEIRNQIFEYVLVPGAVYIHVPPADDLPIKATSPTTPTPSNHFSLLAVTRGIYEDYATCFYRQNTFYLPEGPITDASYFTNLKPEHQRLILHIGIRLSLADLTPAELDCVFRPPSPFGGQQWLNRTFRRFCVVSLRRIWVDKLMWMRLVHKWSRSIGAGGLMSVKIEGALSEPLLMTGEELMVQSTEIKNDEIYEPFLKGGKELKEVMTTVQGYASGLIAANISKNGGKEDDCLDEGIASMVPVSVSLQIPRHC